MALLCSEGRFHLKFFSLISIPTDVVIVDPRVLFFDAPGSTRYPPLNATYSVDELFPELYTSRRWIRSSILRASCHGFSGRAYRHRSPNESAGTLDMFPATCSIADLSRSALLMSHYPNETTHFCARCTTRTVVTSKARTRDRSSCISLDGLHASSGGALLGLLIIAVCSHWKVVRDYAPLCVELITLGRTLRCQGCDDGRRSLEILFIYECHAEYFTASFASGNTYFLFRY